jgi:hypothetical protein
MVEHMIKLDCTDFLLKVTGHKGIVVHEFEGQIALMWHIAALIIESKLEVDLPPILV